MDIISARYHANKFTQRQRSIALLIVALAFVMDLLDATIVNVAIPSIQTHLGTSSTMIQWIVAGYSLTFALLLITGGRMGDAFGYKKLFLIGVAGFTVASLLSGIAPSASFLVASRLLQGAMAALMVPQIISLMQVMYTSSERTKVMGLFGMLGGLAGSLGPILGGVLIKLNLFGWDWRLIFLINIPIGIGAFAAGMRCLPKGKSSNPVRLDFVGTGLIMLALGLLLFPLIEGRNLHWPYWTYAMLIAFIPALGLFVGYELQRFKHKGSALIVPSLFRKRTFTSGLLLNLSLQATMVGFFLALTYTLQAGFGFSPLKAALANLPTAIGIGVSITVVSQSLIPKLGRYAITIGSFLLGIGFAVTAFIMNRYVHGLHVWQLIPSLFVVGIGMGCVIAPMFSVALKDIEVAHAGSASGVLNAVQQLGGAIGIATIGIVYFGTLSHKTALEHTQLFAHAYHNGMLLSLGLLTLVCILSFTLPRHFKVIDEAMIE